MFLYDNERTYVFVDGPSFYGSIRAAGYQLDYRRLLDWFRENTVLVRASYYSTILETMEKNPVKPLIDWLGFNGFTIISKPARDYVDENGRRRVKNDMDVEICIDFLEAVFEGRADHILLFSGNSDFIPLIRVAQRRGVGVTVVSTCEGDRPMISDALRKQADQFVDIADMRKEFERIETGEGT